MIKPNHEYHVVEIDHYSERLPEVVIWCTQRFGKQGEAWFYRGSAVYFQNEKDHMLFVLKFS